MKTIGILAFQGGVAEHAAILKKLGQRVLEVRTVEDLEKCDGLIIPGGESTTIGFFLEATGLMEQIRKRAKRGLPILGTCAGAIVLAKKIESDKVPPSLRLMDIAIKRNGYGKQIDSFYADLRLTAATDRKHRGLSPIKNSLKAAFIRAPIIQNVGPNVETLAYHQQAPVLVQQGKKLAATFHPELRNDATLHQYFLSIF